jgi:site-specific recombinase XerD
VPGLEALVLVGKHVGIAKEKHPSLFRLESHSPHSFRHLIAVHMLEDGESLDVI